MSKNMRAGIGKVRITPPVGIPLLGHGFRVSEGIHDDLWAKVLVLEKDGTTAAIVALDLCWPMPEDNYVKIREAIATATGMKAQNVMVSCTHCHAGPTFEPHPSYPMPIRRQRELIEPWVEALPKRIAEAAEVALSNIGEANVRFGKTLMTGISYNRRKRIAEGVASLIDITSAHEFYFADTSDMPWTIRRQYVYWGMSPEQAEEYAPLGIPDGPIDPDLSVLCIDDESGKPIAILTNFACHAVATSPPVPNLISADFPGFMANLVEQATGAVCLFTAGTGGDIRPYRSTPRGFEESERIGFVLATGALKALKEAQPIEDGQLKVKSEFVEVQLREYPPLEEAQGLVAEKRKRFEQAKAEGRYSDAKRLLDEINTLDFAIGFYGFLGQKGTVTLELQAISIGDVILLSLPNEVNVSIGLQLKDNSWTDKLVLVTLANGCYMYLLKREEYGEGGYEEAACRLAPGSGEKVIDAATKLIGRMRE